MAKRLAQWSGNRAASRFAVLIVCATIIARFERLLRRAVIATCVPSPIDCANAPVRSQEAPGRFVPDRVWHFTRAVSVDRDFPRRRAADRPESADLIDFGRMAHNAPTFGAGDTARSVVDIPH